MERLVSDLNEILPHVPRIPLMLRLVAAVFEENGTVPTERTGLFAEYTSVLFRPAVTNLPDNSGFQFALRHLVRHTFLSSGGDRGLTISEGVMLLRPIKVQPKDLRHDWPVLQQPTPDRELGLSAGDVEFGRGSIEIARGIG